MRDVREMLLGMAYKLTSHQESTHAVLVLALAYLTLHQAGEDGLDS